MSLNNRKQTLKEKIEKVLNDVAPNGLTLKVLCRKVHAYRIGGARAVRGALSELRDKGKVEGFYKQIGARGRKTAVARSLAKDKKEDAA